MATPPLVTIAHDIRTTLDNRRPNIYDQEMVALIANCNQLDSFRDNATYWTGLQFSTDEQILRAELNRLREGLRSKSSLRFIMYERKLKDKVAKLQFGVSMLRSNIHSQALVYIQKRIEDQEMDLRNSGWTTRGLENIELV